MASGSVLTHHDTRSLNMKTDKLTVQGTGITPRAPTPTQDLHLPSGADPMSPLASSRASVTSDEDAAHTADDEEANTMLQGVLNMNKVLESQIEALRLRLQVEDKQHRDERGRLRDEKDAVITARQAEIEDLKESMGSRDERIHNLVKASEEKDRQIQAKVSEIDELKMLVRQTEDIAHKLHKQIGRVKHEKQSLESDSLYKEQNEEIGRLTEEIRQLKTRLGSMEQEIHRATLIVQEQSNKIRQMEEERGAMHASFKEELDRATRAMRQEVERMREVMRQNYEEMRQLREQNRQMHSDVRYIKNLLLHNRMFQQPPQQQHQPHQQQQQQQSTAAGAAQRATAVKPGVQRPLTANPVHIFQPPGHPDLSVNNSHISGGDVSSSVNNLRHQATAGSPPPKGSLSPYGPSQGVTATRQPRVGGGGGGGGGTHTSSIRQSSEALPSSRAVSRTGQHPRPPPSARGNPTSGATTSRATNAPTATAGTASGPGGGAGPSGAKGVFPAICSMKEEPSGLPQIGRSAGQQTFSRAKSGIRASTGKGGKKS